MDPGALQSLREGLRQAARLAGDGRLEHARIAYEGVKTSADALGDTSDFKTLAAEALAGVAWTMRGLPDARAAWVRAARAATRAVDAALDDGTGAMLARALGVRARTYFEGGELRGSLGDWTAIAPALAGATHPELDLFHLQAEAQTRIDEIAQMLRTRGQPLPPRCCSCGRTAEAARVMFAGAAAALCDRCVLAAWRIIDTYRVQADAACGLCGVASRECRRVSSAVVCRRCVGGAAWVLAGPAAGPDECFACGVDGKAAVPSVSHASVTICGACTKRFISELARSHPRKEGRRREGEPTVHRAERCAACGSSVARCFVRGRDGLSMCDCCVDRSEARIAQLAPDGVVTGVPLSMERGAAAVDEPSLPALTALAADEPALLPWIAIVVGRRAMQDDDVAAIRSELERVESMVEPPSSAALAQADLRYMLSMVARNRGDEDVQLAELERGVEAARVAIAKGVGAEASTLLANQLCAQGRTLSDRSGHDLDRAFDRCNDALSALAFDRSAAWPMAVARAYSVLGNTLLSRHRNREARDVLQRSADRSAAYLRTRSDERASRAHAATLISLSNSMERGAMEESLDLLAKAADIFEQYLESDEVAVKDLTVALGNRASVLIDGGQLDPAFAALRRAREAALGGDEVHGGLETLVEELELRLATLLSKHERWEDLDGLADEAIERALERESDASAMLKIRKTAWFTRAEREGKRIVLCGCCELPSSRRDWTVEGKHAAYCDRCIAGALDSPEPPVADASCKLCGQKGPLEEGGTVGDEGICAACISRCRGHRRELEPGPGGVLAWIAEEVSRYSCSFCNKTSREVKKLITGPGCVICDECIGLCNDILAEAGDVERVRSPAKGGFSCTFCGAKEVWKLVSGPDVYICDVCIDDCNEIISGEVERDGAESA